MSCLVWESHCTSPQVLDPKEPGTGQPHISHWEECRNTAVKFAEHMVTWPRAPHHTAPLTASLKFPWSSKSYWIFYPVGSQGTSLLASIKQSFNPLIMASSPPHNYIVHFKTWLCLPPFLLSHVNLVTHLQGGDRITGVRMTSLVLTAPYVPCYGLLFPHTPMWRCISLICL